MGDREIMRTENVLIRIMELDRACATDWHFHTEVQDLFVCLTGAIQVETRNPDQSHLLFPGQRAEVAPMTVHRVRSMTDEKAEYLLIQGVGTYDFRREEAVVGGR